jgi:hypothetical protein
VFKRFFIKKIVEELNTPKPLPMGMKEADEWAERIVKGAMVPSEPGKEQDLHDSLKFTAFSMILTLKPTEAFVSDGYFINGLRKAAANQIAVANQQALQSKIKNRLSKEEELKVIGSGGVVSLVRDETKNKGN